MLSEQNLSRAGQKKQLFTPTHLTVLNIKICITSINIFIKRETRVGKVYSYQMLVSFKISVTYKIHRAQKLCPL